MEEWSVHRSPKSGLVMGVIFLLSPVYWFIYLYTTGPLDGKPFIPVVHPIVNPKTPYDNMNPIYLEGLAVAFFFLVGFLLAATYFNATVETNETEIIRRGLRGQIAKRVAWDKIECVLFDSRTTRYHSPDYTIFSGTTRLIFQPGYSDFDKLLAKVKAHVPDNLWKTM